MYCNIKLQLATEFQLKGTSRMHNPKLFHCWVTQCYNKHYILLEAERSHLFIPRIIFPRSILFFVVAEKGIARFFFHQTFVRLLYTIHLIFVPSWIDAQRNHLLFCRYEFLNSSSDPRNLRNGLIKRLIYNKIRSNYSCRIARNCIAFWPQRVLGPGFARPFFLNPIHHPWLAYFRERNAS